MSKMIWVVLAVAVLLMASGANAADYNVALLGYGIMGTNSVSSGLTFGSLERLGGYPLTRINDGDTGSNTLTWNGALNATYDFGGILFPYVVNGVTNLTINQYIGPDGGWWGDTTNNRTGAVAPALQVTYDYGKSWSTVASSSYTNDYYSVISPRGLNSGLAPVATFALNSPLNGISGIRLFGDGGGTGQGGFVWISEIGVTATKTVPVNIAVLTGATGLKGNNANDDGSMGTVRGTPGEFIDKSLDSTSDTWGSGDTYDFVGVTFSAAKSNVTSIAVQVKQFADGGWWSSTANNSNPLAAGDLQAPKVQVRTTGSSTWTDVASTNAYVTQMTGVPLPGDSGIAAPFVVFTLATPADNIDGIRLFGDSGGSADGGFLGAREVAVMTGTTQSAPTESTWAADVNGNWSESGNWTGGVPTGSTAGAVFNREITGNRTVTLDASRTVGGLTFGDTTPSNDWTLESASSSVLTLQGDGTPEIQVVNRTATISAPVAGTQGLKKTGAGKLILAGTNTYTGNTAVSAGVLNIQNGAALGGSSSDNAVISSGAALEVQGGISAAQNIQLAGSGVSSTGAIRSISGINTLSGTATMTAAGTIGVDSDSLTMGGKVTGAYALTKAGAGTLALTNAANDYSGGNIVSAGTLKGTAASIKGNVNLAAVGANVTFDESGTAAYSGVVSGSGTLTKTGAGTLTLGGAAAYTGATVITGGTLKLTGPISAPVGAIAYYPLDGNTNDASGTGNNLNAGTAGSYVAGAFGNAMQFNGSGQSVYKSGANMTSQPLGNSDHSWSVWLNHTGPTQFGNFLWFGPVSFPGHGLFAGVIDNNTIRNNYIGPDWGTGYGITDGVWYNLAYTYKASTNTGTLYANGVSVATHVYSGVDLTAGSVGLGQLGNGSEWYRGLLDEVLIYGSALDASQIMQLYNRSVPNLASTSVQIDTGGTLDMVKGALGDSTPINLNGGTLLLSDSSPASYANAITANAASAIKTDLAGGITISSAIGGAGSLTKTGSGKLILTAANAYGDTIVSDGTLQLTGSGSLGSGSTIRVASAGTLDASGVGGLTLGSGKTLKGGGTVVGALTIGSGATISPGDSPGTLTVNNAIETWAGGGNYAWQLYDNNLAAGTGWDLAAITGTGNLAVTATSPNKFNIVLQTLSSITPDTQGTPLNWNANLVQSWKIASSAGAITGWDVGDGVASDLFAINATNFVGAGPTASFSVSKTGNDVFLNYVPEPATLALLGLGGLGMLLSRKRR